MNLCCSVGYINRRTNRKRRYGKNFFLPGLAHGSRKFAGYFVEDGEVGVIGGGKTASNYPKLFS
jgi:hypothetical protein